MTWKVDFTPAAEAWFAALGPGDRARMSRRVDQLRAQGPAPGRPAVDSVKGSHHPNMKELRIKRNRSGRGSRSVLTAARSCSSAAARPGTRSTSTAIR